MYAAVYVMLTHIQVERPLRYRNEMPAEDLRLWQRAALMTSLNITVLPKASVSVCLGVHLCVCQRPCLKGNGKKFGFLVVAYSRFQKSLPNEILFLKRIGFLHTEKAISQCAVTECKRSSC